MPKHWKTTLREVGNVLLDSAVDALRDELDLDDGDRPHRRRAAPIRTEAPPPPPPNKNLEYFATLMVVENAPYDVCAAAHKMLSKMYHPDNKETGDEKKAAKVNEAFARVKKLYGR